MQGVARSQGRAKRADRDRSFASGGGAIATDSRVSTERVTAAIRDCLASGTALRISGRGTWLDAGRPVRAGNALSLAEDAGVVSYVPGDLTLTVRAGTTLSEIAGITSERDQWLPLDPYGDPDGTIGATLATASAGPLASSFGSPRDLLLGLEFVNGRGETVRAGGKVVKNVAGFDLSRLLTGSWGTLGVITEVTLRLYARPAADRTFRIDLDGAEKQVGSAQDLLASASQSAEVAQGRYKAGVGSILDLLTAQTALANARAQEVQARANWLLSITSLAHDTGSLGPATAEAKP